MVDYLLGQLPEKEQAELERQYFADEVLFDELLAIEDELRDSYARGELRGSERELFERRLLTAPEQKEQQEFARALCRHLTKGERGPSTLTRPLPRWKLLLHDLAAQPRILFPVLSFAILVLMVGAWWLGRRSTSRLQLPSASSQSASGKAPSTATPTTERQPEAKIMAVVLSPGLVRGNELSTPVVIPSEVTQVRLEARVDVNYPYYNAVLKTPEGKQIWSKQDLEAQAFPDGKRILLYLSKDLLPPGDYVLTILGLPSAKSPEVADEYGFRIGSR